MTVSVYEQCYEIFNLFVELFVFTFTNGGLWVLVMRKHIQLEENPARENPQLSAVFLSPALLHALL